MRQIITFLIAAGILAAGTCWVTGRVMSLYHVPFKTRRGRGVHVAASVVVGLFCAARSFAGILVLHVVGVFALIDAAAWLLRRILRGRGSERLRKVLHTVYHSCAVPALLLLLILGYGAYNMGHLTGTEYTLTSEKLSHDHRIVFLSDIHYDTIQDPEVLKGKASEINALEPDVVILGGDIVEENTSKEAMREVFALLGGLESRYGVYYVYGNHDRQPYATERAYTDEELRQTIEESGVTILQDRFVAIQDDLILAGREDAAWGYRSTRATTEELLRDADRGRYIILADHQPVEAAENAAQGVDLELSGHTHAGQLFPVGCFNAWFGALNYGQYQVDGCTVIVSSGVAGWGYPIKTQGKCEYVVVRLRQAERK